MGATSVATGSGISYYESHAREGIEAALERGYYLKAVLAGEPRPIAMGRGLAPLGLSVGAVLDNDTAKAVFEEHRHPVTGEQLGQKRSAYAGPAVRLARAAIRAKVVLPESMTRALKAKELTDDLAVTMELAKLVTPEELTAIKTKADRSQRKSVAYYDVLYTQDKTTSVAHAAADVAGDDRAGDVFEEALRRGAQATVEFFDRTLYVRVGDHSKSVEGRSSGRYARARGIAAAAYGHHTNRAGDMHDHAHVLVVNRAQCGEDEKYRALDGTQVFNSMSATTALGSRASEMHISAELGWRWAKKPDGSRYLPAIDDSTIKQFSKRASAIEERLAEWADRYERDTGQAPTERQRDQAHRNIQRRTRAAKPEVIEARDVAVAKWDDESNEALSDGYKALTKDGRKFARERAKPGYVGDVIDQEAVLTEALVKLITERTYFTRWHMLGEIDRAMPANLPVGMTFEQYRETVFGLVDQGVRRIGVEALRPVGVIDRNVPAKFVRDDGRSVFSPPDDDLYASVETLAAEAYLLAQIDREDSPGIGRDRAELVATAAGLEGDQAQAVATVLSSQRCLEVLVGPAGTGKSFTVAKLAEAWRAEDLGHVIGLAKSNAAAAVLRGEGLADSWNCDQWLGAQERIASGRGRLRDVSMKLAPGTLVVVDEASMAETATLVAITHYVERAGGKVLLTGDHHQLASVGAGGFFELAATDAELRTTGAVSELTDVRRFADLNPWEGAASLRLRDGDAAVLADYDRRGRIVEAGDADSALGIACEQYVTDLLQGKDVLVVVASGEEAAAAAMKIRRELVDLGLVDDTQRLELANGSVAGIGDVVQARENNYKLTDSWGKAVSNRDRLRIVEVMTSGAVITKRADNGRTVVLDRDYVAKYVELSYALTGHGAQGRTVDTCYAVVTQAMDRAALYVAMTRAKERNVAVVNIGDAEGDHHIDESGSDFDRDGVAVLTDVIERASTSRSATAAKRAQIDASQSLARLGPAWAAAVGHLVEAADRSEVADILGPALMARLDADEAKGAFWFQYAATRDRGIDPADALRSTLAGREVTSATDLAPLLAWRLEGQCHMAWTPAPYSPHVKRAVSGAESARPAERSQVAEVLGPDLMARLEADEAQGAFWYRFRETRAAGVDPIDALRSTLAGREIGSAKDVASLLAWRLEGMRHMEWEPAPLPQDQVPADVVVVARTYVERTPVDESLASGSLVTNTVDAYARQLAAAMDERVAVLGQRTARDAPEWATHHLGPVPDAGTTARDDWEARAATVAAYREQYVTSNFIDVADPVGPAPKAARAPERYLDWQKANEALGIDRGPLSRVAEATDRELRQAVSRWQEATERAPAYVRHELNAARVDARRQRDRFVRLEAVLKDGPHGREKLDERRAELEAAEAYVETLTAMHADREAWFEQTSVTRTTAREAAAELDRRHPDRTIDVAAAEPEELTTVELARYERRQVQREQRDIGVPGLGISR